MALTFASLFSGAGGMDLGFEQAGWQCRLACELDPDPASSWRANRPGNEGAMVQMDAQWLVPILGNVPVTAVIGGPPCQGFSNAGRQDPADPRSQMVWTFLDAVAAVRPSVFVMENVAALAENDRWKSVRAKYLKRCQEMGYEVSVRVLQSSDFGVPQSRQRAIFVGHSGAFDRYAFEAALSEQREAAPTAREAILSAGKYGSDENPATATGRVSLAKSPVLRPDPYAGMLVNGAGRPVRLDGVSMTLPASMGGNRTPIVDQKALEDPAAQNWFEAYHARLTAGAKPGCMKVPEGRLRRLTVTEAAAIQTFPHEYKFVGTKSSVYRQIGNAVPPKLARAVAVAAAKGLKADATSKEQK